MTAVQPRGWAKVKTAASYADVSTRTLRKWFDNGLRHVKAPSGALLVKFQWLDEFLEQYENTNADNQIDQIVDEVLDGVLPNKGAKSSKKGNQRL